MPNTIDHVSHSQMAMWMRCPAQWDYRYVQKLKIPPSGSLIQGSVYHSTVEFNFNQKMTYGENMLLPNIMDLVGTVWDEKLAHEPEVDWKDENKDQLLDETANLIRAYMTSAACEIMPVAVEKEVHSTIAGTQFQCRIDLITDKEIVVDHKTSGRAYVQGDVDKDDQATACAFSLGKGIIFENHVAIKSKTPRIQVVRTYRTVDDIEWWTVQMSKVLQQMKSGIAPANPNNYLCSEKWCGYFDRCRGKCYRTYSSG